MNDTSTRAGQGAAAAVPDTRGAPDPDWWRGAAIYQIYPRSFQDSDGDGIGDLAGIAARLEHVAALGADAVWISPFYPSPMKDFGYDVSDHVDVDPMFGDLDAFDAMLARAHALGLRVLIDLVLSHTSERHPWFVRSCASRDGALADWYVWADARPDGGPPNNWLSIFGGPGWSWHPTRCQYYQHNFLASQPDLNFHHPEVQQAALDIARFWLERGVDGFRLDTVNFYFCDARLRDNPPLGNAHRETALTPDINPYGRQDHVHDKNRPENLAFLERFRALLDAYPAVTSVGEIGDAQYATRLLGEYVGPTRLHMCYTFDFLGGERPGASEMAATLERFRAECGDAWVCWAFSNHDVTRHATRWGVSGRHRLAQLKMLASLLVSLRGSLCLYQGEELGLEEADIAFEELRDPYGIAFWPDFRGRDGCRTPMVWSAADARGGFTEGEPWLPVPAAHRALAVDAQEGDAGSLLAHYRRALAFRRATPALVRGGLDRIRAEGDVLSFRRHADGTTLHCAFNLGGTRARHAFAGGLGARLLDVPDGGATLAEGDGTRAAGADATLELPPYGAAVVRLAPDDGHDG